MRNISSTPIEDTIGFGVFSPGRIVIRSGAAAALLEEQLESRLYLNQHISGNWGDLSLDEKETNDRAVTSGAKVSSRYILPKTFKNLWIITESDRSTTTIFLPSEY